MFFFDILRTEISKAFSEMRYGVKLQKVTVAKAYCTPARNIVTNALLPYGVKIYGYKEYCKWTLPKAWLRQQGITDNAEVSYKLLPMATVAEVTVSVQAAAWAEYLLLRTGKLYVPGKYVNRRNQKWALKYGGVMPVSWNRGEPWIEKHCTEGISAWQALRKK